MASIIRPTKAIATDDCAIVHADCENPKVSVAHARWPSALQVQVIGKIAPGGALLQLETAVGGERVAEEPEDDPLPRIC